MFREYAEFAEHIRHLHNELFFINFFNLID